VKPFNVNQNLKHSPTGGGTFVLAKVPKTIRAIASPIANIHVCSGFPRAKVRLGGALGTRYARVARPDPRLSTRHSARGSADDLIRTPVLHDYKQII
jgi:hypothetical protein